MLEDYDDVVGFSPLLKVMMSDTSGADNTLTVLILLFILIVLVLLLFYLYKRLNHETKGEYTIRRLVYGEGGLRDRVMQGVTVVEARLGDRIRSRTHEEEQALSRAEDGSSGKEEEGEEDAEQGHSENENKTEEKEEEHQNDSSDDYSSVDLKERVKQNKGKEEEKKEEEQDEDEVAKDEAAKDGAKGDDSKQEEDVKNEERVGLLVDLKTFSGSAIWSEEKTEETNVTAL
ncbi:hypothetical protein PHYPO_G00195440 [Pangasianodon hypophthalmus]|uniref:Uncharacterized protein n=2 Tax=Pangasianodon hypophthalmus TaxID=310915 RepID=A0A5N5PKF9_PANHP|nr:hypothetical protein PHYPO_G00195440 [Pangasianodon hypophthalmus]